MSIRGGVLQRAAELTERDRDAVYGDPLDNMSCVAELRRIYRQHAAGKYSPAHDAAMEELLLKVGRVASGGLHRDNYVDGSAYLAVAFECEQRMRESGMAGSVYAEMIAKAPAIAVHDARGIKP